MSDAYHLSPVEQRGQVRRQKAIGEGLKRFYGEATSEPAPEDFSQLLAKADRRRRISPGN